MDASARQSKAGQLVLALFAGLFLTGSSLAQEPDAAAAQETDPLEIGKQEEVDVVVLDRKDRTVDDLTIEDFEIVVDGEIRSLDSLDLACEEGAAEDARAVSHPKKRHDLPSGSGQQIVLAMDYFHLGQTQLAAVYDQAKRMVRHAAEDDSIMVAALIGGVRIEQPFTTDHERVYQALHRMEYDKSLRRAGNAYPLRLTAGGVRGEG